MRSAFLFFVVFSFSTAAHTQPVYVENFQAYAIDTDIEDSPPSYSLGNSAEAPNGTVQENATWSSQAARIITTGWSTAIYDGTEFEYTDLTVRVGTSSRNLLFFRCGDQDNLWSLGGYIFQVTPNVANETILYRISATGSSLLSLGNTSSSGITTSDYELRVVADGTNLKCYINGELKIDLDDATYPEGKIGFGTFAGTAWFDNVTVDNGILSGSLSPYKNAKQDRFPFVTPRWAWPF